MAQITQNKMIAWLEARKLEADQEGQAIIEAILEKVRQGRKKEPTPERYKEFVGIYNQFLLESVGVGAKMDPSEGKALKSIIKYLKEQSNEQNTEGAIKAWQYILDNWTMLSSFIQSQKSLKQINKNLIEILEQIRNGHAKSKQQHSENSREQLKHNIKRARGQ